MSGRRQHFIPQFVLLGFAQAGTGKVPRVWTYRQSGSALSTAVKETAAQRDFHGNPLAGEGQLDDEITRIESGLAPKLSDLRALPLGAQAPPEVASELVAHLTIRTAHLRGIAADALDEIVPRVLAPFGDDARLGDALGFGTGNPSPEIAKEIDTQIEQMRRLPWAKPPQGDLGPHVRRFLAAIPKEAAAQQAKLARMLTAKLREQAASMAKRGHNNALLKTLDAGARREALARFQWRLRPGPPEGAILSDCVALALARDGSIAPLTFLDIKKMHGAFMPLSPDKVLVGFRGAGADFSAERLNRDAASCSHSFFVAASRHPSFERLQKKIGEVPRRLLDEVIADAGKKHPLDRSGNSIE